MGQRRPKFSQLRVFERKLAIDERYLMKDCSKERYSGYLRNDV